MHKHLVTLIVISCIVLSWESTVVSSSASEAVPQAAVPTPPQGATTVDPVRNSLELEKLKNENEKLKRESEKLVAETRNLGRVDYARWGPVLALIGAIIAAVLALWGVLSSATRNLTGTIRTAQGAYEGSLETARRESEYKVGEAIHQKRMTIYPDLMKAMRPLAIYFPTDASGRVSTLDASACREMGRKLSNWYFDQGGLYLSLEGRNRYFALAAALTLASNENVTLRVPGPPHQRSGIDDSTVNTYRAALGITPDVYRTTNSLAKWTFGEDMPGADKDVQAIKDYVLLQALSSYLRSALAEDLDARRPPAYKTDKTTGLSAA